MGEGRYFQRGKKMCIGSVTGNTMGWTRDRKKMVGGGLEPGEPTGPDVSGAG